MTERNDEKEDEIALVRDGEEESKKLRKGKESWIRPKCGETNVEVRADR